MTAQSNAVRESVISELTARSADVSRINGIFVLIVDSVVERLASSLQRIDNAQISGPEITL